MFFALNSVAKSLNGGDDQAFFRGKPRENGSERRLTQEAGFDEDGTCVCVCIIYILWPHSQLTEVPGTGTKLQLQTCIPAVRFLTLSAPQQELQNVS